MASREEWIGRTGQEWARRGTALERLLGPPADAGLQALGVSPGWRVLDLGCGAGVSTQALAEVVGPTGSVLGVDVSPDLVAQAQDRLAGLPNAEVVEADAQTHAFASGTFDALYSRFGSMFFDNPEAAFSNIRRGLCPGAPAVFVAWRAPRLNDWTAVPMAFASEGLAPPKRPSGPGPFSWADSGVVEAQLVAGGFEGISAQAYDFRAEISEGNDPDPVARAVLFMMRIGPLAARLRGASDEIKRSAEAFLTERLSDHVQDGAVRLAAAAWIVSARA